MDLFTILLYVLVVLSIVAVTFLIVIFFRVNQLLARMERVAAVGEHITDAIIAFESLPALVIKKITKYFFEK